MYKGAYTHIDIIMYYSSGNIIPKLGVVYK